MGTATRLLSALSFCRIPIERYGVLVIVTALLVLFAMQAVLSMRQKSVTDDELEYIAEGYYHLTTGKFDVGPAHPPLVKMLAALPLLILQPDLPPLAVPATAYRRLNNLEVWRFARAFLYENRVDADTILFAARLPIVGLGVLLGIFVFLWSRELYGKHAGFLALFLYALSPNVLAHTRLVTMDVGLATFTFIAGYYFWRYINRASLLDLAASALSLSAAALTKTPAMFMMPIALIYCSVLVLGRYEIAISPSLPFISRIPAGYVRVRQIASFGISFAAIGIVSLVLINVGYLFSGSFQPASAYISPQAVSKAVGGQSLPVRKVIDGLMAVPLPVPKPLVELAKWELGPKLASGTTVYLAGHLSRKGWWYDMLFAFLIKTPIAFLCLLGASVYQLARAGRISSAEWLFLILCSFWLAAFSYLSNQSIGLRYVLPIFPFLHVLASRIVREGVRLENWARVGLAVLLLWYGLGTLRIYPDYLAYFNELIGGPRNGYRYLDDSNLDWGQDLKKLKKYLDAHGIEHIQLAYFGSADPGYYGIKYDYLPSIGLPPPPGKPWWYEVKRKDLAPLDLSGGPIAISATLLVGIFYPGYYSKLLELQPIDQVGYSILIYQPPGPTASRR